MMMDKWCHIESTIEGELYSNANRANAAAMRVLAGHGLLSIQSEYGRRVIGRWTEAACDYGADVDFKAFRAWQAIPKQRIVYRKNEE